MMYRLFLNGQLYWQGQDPVQRCREVTKLYNQHRTFDCLSWDSIDVAENGVISWDFPSTSTKDWYHIIDQHGKLSCSCPGFIFRGDCKHLKTYIETIAQ